MPPQATWLKAADPAAYFEAGADLSLKMQQARDRKKQLKALSDFHQEQLDTQLNRLQETERYHDQLRDKNDEMIDLRRQISSTNNDTELAKLKEKYDALSASADRLQANIGSKWDIASMNNDTRQRGQDIASGDRRYNTDWSSFDRERGQDNSMQLGQQRLSQAATLAGNRQDQSDENNRTSTISKLTTEFLKADPSAAQLGDAGDIARSQALQKGMDAYDVIKAARQKASQRAASLVPMDANAQPPGQATPPPQGMGDRLMMDAGLNKTPPPTQSPRVKVKDPSGKLFTIPASQLQQAQQQGYVPAQ